MAAEPKKQGTLSKMHGELGIGGWIGLVIILGFILPIAGILVAPAAEYVWGKSVMSFNTLAAQYAARHPKTDGE